MPYCSSLPTWPMNKTVEASAFRLYIVRCPEYKSDAPQAVKGSKPLRPSAGTRQFPRTCLRSSSRALQGRAGHPGSTSSLYGQSSRVTFPLTSIGSVYPEILDAAHAMTVFSLNSVMLLQM